MDELCHSDVVKKIMPTPDYIKVAQTCIGRLINVAERGGTSVDITDLGINDDVIEALQSKGYVIQNKKYQAEDGSPAQLYRIMCG